VERSLQTFEGDQPMRFTLLFGQPGSETLTVRQSTEFPLQGNLNTD
jgi:hypothetical protein